jgi:hypothetical protein
MLEILEWLSNGWLLKKDSAPWSWLVGWLVGWLGGWLVGWFVKDYLTTPSIASVAKL